MDQAKIQAKIDPGSFRDPSGFVLTVGDRVFRALSKPSLETLRTLKEREILKELEEDALIVGTHFDIDEELLTKLRRAAPGMQGFVEHDRLPLISFPYEWSFSMLCDAGLLQLEIQRRLLKKGFCLKDATPYNIQFSGPRPVFIDTPSIEERQPSGLWEAYGQFCQMILFPLLLNRYGGWSTKSYYLEHLNGVDVSEISKTLGFFGSWRLDSFVDVGLQSLLQRGGETSSPEKLQTMRTNRAGGASAQEFLLNRLTRLITSLRKDQQQGSSRWTSYAEESTYSDDETKNKEKFLQEFLKEYKPENLLDIGANTGRYSKAAAKHGTRVVALDSDHACVDRLYGAESITTLWMDIANPSPAIGLANKERPAFGDRVRCDTVIAFALIHHFYIASGAPLEMVLAALCALTNRFLLIEYVDPEDSQFRSLLGLRNRDLSEMQKDSFRAALEKFGRIVKTLDLNSTRTLYLLET